MRDYKFQRGQVWLLKGKDAHKDSGRPVLIISPDEHSNSTSPNILVIPCTSKLQRYGLTGAVKYTTFEGRESVILPSSLISVPRGDLYYYLSTLDSELMVQVEKGILEALGLKKTAESSVQEVNSQQVNSQPKTFREYVQERGITFENQENQESQENHVPSIAELKSNPFKSTPIQTNGFSSMAPNGFNNLSSTTTSNNSLSSSKPKSNRGGARNRLSIEYCEKFLSIYTTEGPQACADLFHITKAQAASRAHTYRNKLKQAKKI